MFHAGFPLRMALLTGALLAGVTLAVAPRDDVAAQAESPAKEPQIEAATILLEVTSQGGNWFSPWQRDNTRRSSGSGFIVANRRVMTNAHVVSDAKQIVARRNGDSTPYIAEIAFIAHDSDLALLTVADDAFFQDVAPLPIGDLPSLETRVRTYGYPAGGEKISRTEGVVSRVEYITYLHSGADAHLAIQTDSAINPGNSGGPVVQAGRVVGVAFQTSTNLNDVGYFIPTSVIRRFLEDIADGRYDGYGELGVVTNNLINPTYRAFLRMGSEQSGVVVERVIPGTSAHGLVTQGDVIMAIDGRSVAIDGTISYHGHTLNFEQLVEEKQLNDPVALTLWREGARRELTFPLKRYVEADRLRSTFDVLPSYVIYAGLLFMRLDQEYLRTFGNYWRNADKALLYDHFYSAVDDPTSAEMEKVVLTRILPHPVNSAYRNRSNSVIAAINGRPIHGLSDIPRALDGGEGAFHTIELNRSDILIVLDREQADAAHGEILRVYGIPSDQRLP